MAEESMTKAIGEDRLAAAMERIAAALEGLLEIVVRIDGEDRADGFSDEHTTSLEVPHS